MISINVIDKATPQLRLLIARIENPLPGLKVSGAAVVGLLKRHFREKGKTPNKLGGERSYFWAGSGGKPGILSSVNLAQTGAAQVTVSVSDPRFMQKVKGGTIPAKRKEFLTIPIAPEAYGRYASVLARELGIRLFRVKLKRDGRLFLAGVKNGGPIKFYYRLKKEVNQNPDPTALPPESAINDAATNAFSGWMKRGGH